MMGATWNKPRPYLRDAAVLLLRHHLSRMSRKRAGALLKQISKPGHPENNLFARVRFSELFAACVDFLEFCKG
jgi:hypothetical protein